ncbi:MAG: hypothetical protein QE272_00610 [Nevskia sp.]|nr:hypothetical protein [Nevskia sp.]
MRNILLGCGLLLTASMLPAARADVLNLPAPATATASAALPIRGESQRTVLSRYGEPAKRHAAVGGGSAAQPPITRWDYAGFSVFFENTHVVDAVVPGAPAPLFNTGELRPTSGG